jgi:L-cysteine:1D-myo-inositol 2-amino-2-deoxy-alpha-D-glucopyranoside ligase
VLVAIRERMAEDLDTPGALAVVDAWADAMLAEEHEADFDQHEPTDVDSAGLVSDVVDALLGVRL